MGKEGKPEEYDLLIGKLSSRINRKYLPLYKSAVEYLPTIDKCGTIMDLGCGVGFFTKVLFEKGYTKYIGIDFAPALLEEAKKRVPEATFILGNLRNKEIHKIFQKHKIFTILEVLEHIEKDLDVIENIPHGSLVIFSVPKFNSKFHVRYFRNMNEIIGRFGPFLDFKESKKIRGLFLSKCIKK